MCDACHVPVRHLSRGHAISVSSFRGSLPCASPRWGHRNMTAFPWASVLPPGRWYAESECLSFWKQPQVQVQPAGPGCGMWAKPPASTPHWSGRELPWNAQTSGRIKDLILGVLNAVRATSEPSLAYFGTRIKEFVIHWCPEMSMLLFIIKRKSKAKARGSGQR